MCRGRYGAKRYDVIQKVSFEKDCPEEQVHIKDKLTLQHPSIHIHTFKVEACGVVYLYEQEAYRIYEKGCTPLSKVK